MHHELEEHSKYIVSGHQAISHCLPRRTAAEFQASTLEWNKVCSKSTGHSSCHEVFYMSFSGRQLR